MRRFFTPPEQAAALAAQRSLRLAQEDLARAEVVLQTQQEEERMAEKAATLGLPWPEPKRPRGPPSRQRRFEEAIYKAIRENTLLWTRKQSF